jgi:NlpC/P60 family
LDVQRPTFITALLVSALAPQAVCGQSVVSAGVYLGYNDALPSSSPVAAAGATFWFGAIGLRGSGALPLTTDGASGSSVVEGQLTEAWTVDGDVILAPFEALVSRRSARGGVSPYLFVGTGAETWHGPDAATSTMATWSYGGGISVPLLSPLRLESDARLRRPLLGSSSEFDSLPSGWEYRVGFSFRFGGGSSRRREHGVGRPDPAPRPAPVSLPASARVARVLSTAERQLGVPYRYGGTSPETGFDCSGFVQYVFAKHDVRLPRTSRQMAMVGERLRPSLPSLRAGDLVMFAEDGAPISHVAIFAGRNRIIHSSASGGGVRYENLDSPRGRWFVRRLVAARRVIADGRNLVDALNELNFRPVELDPPDHAPRP